MGSLGRVHYTLDPDTLFDEFRQRGVPFVKELSFIDEGLWGFEITDADGYVLAFFQVRDKGVPLSTQADIQMEPTRVASE